MQRMACIDATGQMHGMDAYGSCGVQSEPGGQGGRPEVWVARERSVMLVGKGVARSSGSKSCVC